MRAFVILEHRIWLATIALGLGCAFVPGHAEAQSLTSGSLRGTVQTADGEPVSGAAITIESRLGMPVASLTSDRSGGFRSQLLTPGEYRVLVEQIGFQPVRTSGVVITPGSTTSLTVSLERRPPPITSVTEVTNAGARAGGASGTLVTGAALGAFDLPSSLDGLGRVVPALVAPADGRPGLALSGGGLDISRSRLFVDGVMETLLRHPGLPGEPPSAPVFARVGQSQLQFLPSASDLEWRGVPGTLVAGQSRGGEGKFSVAPFASFSSAKLGRNKLDNPEDSSASSFQLGAVLSGSIIPDTAHLFVDGAYESLEQPTAAPWASDSATYQGGPVGLRQTLVSIANDNFHTAMGRFAAPTVRSWKGGHGEGRLDWQVGAANRVAVRFGYASWKENNPLLGSDLFFGTGATLQAHDLSAATSVTTSGVLLSNELRAGFNLARRDWSSSAPTGTLLSGAGVAFGSRPEVPGSFDVKRLDLTDAVQLERGHHLFKGGVALNLTNYSQDYRFGSRGLFTFGNLDDFAAGNGSYFRIEGPALTPGFTVVEPGFFVQDTWSATPEIQLQAGFRFDTQVFPKGRIAPDSAWINASGIPNDSLRKGGGTFSPRASFVWDVQQRGEWILRGSGGLYRGELDPALFAEAQLFDGAASVRRGQGSFASWPTADAATASYSATRLTLFAPSYRAPRTAKFDLGLARGIHGGTSVSVWAGYSHTDYLLRRVDLNRPTAGTASTQDGRPVFGTLVQQGALIEPAPGSNRKFSDFDLVSGLAPTGYADHYEVTVNLEHHATRGLSFDATYTYGKTTDNLVGQLQGDPADQLDPFPGGLPGGGDWSVGRSDLDVPHRVAASAQWRSSGKTPVGVGARWRWRSGLPFTPGFRPGVDPNGDFGGNNDPVFIDQALQSVLAAAGCSGVAGSFAARNSCRGPNLMALDLRLSVGLPVHFGSGGVLALTVDAFNVVSAKNGVVDRAALLVDPAGAISAGSNGRLVLPLVANPGFGTLLSRRVEPRLIRFGLRMEY